MIVVTTIVPIAMRVIRLDHRPRVLLTFDFESKFITTPAIWLFFLRPDQTEALAQPLARQATLCPELTLETTELYPALASHGVLSGL
jgi:hypothetical protein